MACEGVSGRLQSAEHYERLIADAGPAATRHETFVAVSIDERRCRRAVRAAGGGPDGISQVLMNELSWVENGLRRCDVQVVGWLGPVDLGRLVRTQYDPLSTQSIDNRGKRRPRTRRPAPRRRTDGGEVDLQPLPHRQRRARRLLDRLLAADAGAGRLALPAAGARRSASHRVGHRRTHRTVAVLPRGPQRQGAEAHGRGPARTFGQIETALDDEEHAAVLRRERELVHGHVEYRFTGYVTVSAATESELEEACAQIEQAAVRSVLEVRRVFGEQDQAFVAAALPLTRGVR